MKFYYANATCSLAVHAALRATGTPFEAIAVDLATHRTAGGGDYYAVSPRGYVPLLEFDDGSRHTEGAALLQWVADRDPARALIGEPGSARRLAVLEWLAFVASELHKPFSWLWHKETAESTRDTVKAKLATRFAEMDALLATRAFLAGADPSVADFYGFAVVNWCRYLAIPLAAYPALEAWLGRVQAQPAMTAAMTAEGLLK